MMIGYGLDIPGLKTATPGSTGEVICEQGVCGAKQEVWEKKLADSKKSGYLIGGAVGLVAGMVILKILG